jgi:hypothetical protein
VHASPVVGVSIFVVVIVGVMVVLPHVVVNIEVIFVDVVVHVYMSEDILELWVVVIGNSREWIENIWIHFLYLAHGVPLILLGCLASSLHLWCNYQIVESTCHGVE